MSLDVLRLFDARSQQFAPIGSQMLLPPFLPGCRPRPLSARSPASRSLAQRRSPLSRQLHAAMLRLPAALLVVAAASIVNQAIGSAERSAIRSISTRCFGGQRSARRGS